MRALALVGLIAIAFGMGSYYATDHFGAFNYANVILGGLALTVAAARGLSRLRGASAPAFRGVLTRGLLGILAAVLLAQSPWSGPPTTRGSSSTGPSRGSSHSPKPPSPRSPTYPANSPPI